MINKYFNADASRRLIDIIEVYKNCQKYLKGTQYEFQLV
jgi:hypothetical protein